MPTTTSSLDYAGALNEGRTAELLGVSVRTLQNWRLRGGGPRYLKLGRSVRYRVSDLTAFMEGCLAASTTEADARRAVNA